MNFSKSIRSFSSVIAVVAVGACTDQKLSTPPVPVSASNQSVVTEQNPFNESVGKSIDKTTGIRWIGNHLKSNSANRNSEYVIQASVLSNILADKSCVGISLYYAQTAAGLVHIIPLGVTGNGKLIKTEKVSIENKEVAWETGWLWINNYSGPVNAHYFGRKTFGRLLQDQMSPAIRLSLAMNDSSIPQLLMSNAMEPNPVSYEDMSFLCPPTCPVMN